jgi:predicted nucleotidyltransferase component of viral defense system
MLTIEEIIRHYPEKLRGFRENLLKEYLQYRIMDIIYASSFSADLVFLGGTALRIVHQGTRFSEDLDFDNCGLSEGQFTEVADLIQKKLQLDGYTVVMKNVLRSAWHCHVDFPGLLFAQGMTGHKEERILIQIDVEPQQYAYTPAKFFINRFGLFRTINTVPVSLLLAQKVYACLNRKREKGRDFFDIVFLMAKADPDYDYLKTKIGITNRNEMITALKARARTVDLKALSNDVEPFLMDPSQKDRVLLFQEWLNSL